jgi:acylpyruvate hydrolase
MRLTSFERPSAEPTIGVVVGDDASGEYIADVQHGFAAVLMSRGRDAGLSFAQARFALQSNMRTILSLSPKIYARLDEATAMVASLVKERGYAECERAALVHRVADVRLLPPVATPGKMLFAGANYRAHREEAEAAGRRGYGDIPRIFSKYPSTLAGPYDPVRIPSYSAQLDYEVELAVVIGRRCKDVDEDEAFDVVAGYTVTNDLSARDVQRAEVRDALVFQGKNFDTAAPMGPYLVTADEVPEPHNLRLCCVVDGDLRQDANTADMVWSIPQLIAHCSRMTLEPGDIVSTGSPAGVAAARSDAEAYYLRRGQLVESEVVGVGRMSNRVA